MTQASSSYPTFGLFSGGHDSLTSTALATEMPGFVAAVHINTGIGIEQTREFVRETCRMQGWPLIELHAERTYEDLVLTRGGFPSGPKSHNSMYWYLKQKQLNRLVREHKQGARGRVVLVTGIRKQESTRRMGASISVPERRDGAKIWLNPILEWSAHQCLDFMAERGLAHNPVVDLLHRSGECLCGALAHRDEIREIDLWFPAAGARIHALEAKARERGLRGQRWAAPSSRRALRQTKALVMCNSCQLDYLAGTA